MERFRRWWYGLHQIRYWNWCSIIAYYFNVAGYALFFLFYLPILYFSFSQNCKKQILSTIWNVAHIICTVLQWLYITTFFQSLKFKAFRFKFHGIEYQICLVVNGGSSLYSLNEILFFVIQVKTLYGTLLLNLKFAVAQCFYSIWYNPNTLNVLCI